MNKYSLIILLGFLLSLSVYAEDKKKKPIGIDFFTEIKSISNLQERDSNIYFTVRQADKKTNDYYNDLYQLIDGKPVQLSKEVADRLFPKSKNQGIYVDKDRFFYTSSYNRQKDENKSYRIFDELPFWSNGRGDVNGHRTHLYYYNKGVSTLLSDTLENDNSPELSPDKKTLAYIKRDAYSGKAPEGNHLITLNVETLEKKVWNLFEKASYGGIQFINNDELFLTINRSLEHDKIENSGLYRLNIRTGKLTEIYDGSTYSLGNSITSDVGGGGRAKVTFDNDGVIFVTTDVDYAPLIHLAYKNAKVTLLTPRGIDIQEYIPYKDGFLAVGVVGQQGSELYQIDKKGNYSPLTSINKSVFDAHTVVHPLEITYVNEDNITLRGYVLPPVDYEKGKKYPAILDIHGGPKATYGTVFFHEMQYWANQGYAVLFTNPTGSDGRGSKFSDIRGKFGEIDYHDILTFADTVLAKVDFIDNDRVGVTGGSYGGLMTNWIIGHTNRFKAAVSQRSISSWLSFSNTSDIGSSFTYNYWGTDIWKNETLLWERSPLKYADQVHTPTLFIHSEEDYRCPLSEGLQMYYALQYFEVPCRIVIFKGENHELSRSGKPQNRIKRLDEITSWFNKYLK